MNSSFKNLHVSGDFYTSLGVAVGSRIPGVHAEGKPLGGVRFAIKDIFEVEGLRTTAGNRAFYSLSNAATRTCPAIKRLVDAGAELLGTLKLGSLIAREEPTESVDYHAPFNPRADGYQSAWSSSGGSGAAIASYDWIDFTIGTDSISPFDTIIPEGSHLLTSLQQQQGVVADPRWQMELSRFALLIT